MKRSRFDDISYLDYCFGPESSQKDWETLGDTLAREWVYLRELILKDSKVNEPIKDD